MSEIIFVVTTAIIIGGMFAILHTLEETRQLIRNSNLYKLTNYNTIMKSVKLSNSPAEEGGE